jgi:hypothetical protein
MKIFTIFGVSIVLCFIKILYDNRNFNTFSAFRIVISATSAVSACRFLETISLIYELTRKYSECFSIMVKYVNMSRLLYSNIFKYTVL